MEMLKDNKKREKQEDEKASSLCLGSERVML
jgi:hypothetical protein